MDKKKIERERRKDLRLSVSEPITLKFQIVKEKGVFKVRAKKHTRAEDISVGGIRIELPLLKELQIERIVNGHDKLVLELEVPFLKKPLKVTGKIAWIKKGEKKGKVINITGISFEDIKEKDREKVLSWLINLCFKNGCKLEKDYYFKV